MTENRLADETSPYLLQHKDNPVHWHPWDETAFATARKEDKPILLSVGYAACHWCHVMAHESFEDPEIARLMNEKFVNIKVDREQRPDVDTIYQHALALLGTPGGWPLTMFLTPKGEPFWGGTYFPPDARFGRPGFPDVLQRIAQVYHEEKDAVEKNRKALTGALADLWSADMGGEISLPMLDELASQMLIDVDPEHGGLSGAPKFPQVPYFEFLYRAGMRTGEEKYRRAATLTLDHMSQGGIYDHLGGGYARYAVDERWLVPHFEKMLYDNALLTGLLTLAWQDTGEPLYKQRLEETVGWIKREMIAENMAFAASLDADSEGEEGKFYVWTKDEIAALLPGDIAGRFMEIYDVRDGGNWEGKTILNRLGHIALKDEKEEAALAEARRTLFEERENRVRPGWDDKVLADWNGLMIAALARAAAALDRSGWAAMAETAFSAIETHLQYDQGDEKRLYHSWRAGKAQTPGMLDDYAAMSLAALALYEITAKPDYLEAAEQWAAVLDAHFLDTDKGGYFLTPDDGEALIVRARAAHDAATPSGNGMAAELLARLYHLTGKAHYRDRAAETVRAFTGDVRRAAPALGTLLNSFELLENATQVVIVGEREAEDTTPLLRAAFEAALPLRVLQVVATGEDLPDGHPAKGKTAKNGQATAYVCVGAACSAPITEADALREELRAQTNKLPHARGDR